MPELATWPHRFIQNIHSDVISCFLIFFSFQPCDTPVSPTRRRTHTHDRARTRIANDLIGLFVYSSFSLTCRERFFFFLNKVVQCVCLTLLSDGIDTDRLDQVWTCLSSFCPYFLGFSPPAFSEPTERIHVRSTHTNFVMCTGA